MKKAILKNLMILSFAFAGLFLIGNNVFAGVDDQDSDCPGDDVGGGSIQLYRHSCSNYHNYWECRNGVTHWTCDTWSSC